MTEQTLTPSKVGAWLACEHAATLDRRVAAGILDRPQIRGSFATLITEKGLDHERGCLAEYRGQQTSVFEVPDRNRGEPFDDWVRRIGNPTSGRDGVIYQLPLAHDGVRGIADFVELVDDELGRRWEPVDAKLTRAEAKPAHLLQLCFYAEALEALTGVAPVEVHVWLGSGRRESYRAAEFMPYWRRVRNRISQLLTPTEESPTAPEPCDHCQFCDFQTLCAQQWRDVDALHLVAGIRRGDRHELAAAGVTTVGALAALDEAPAVESVNRIQRLISQAQLQVRARAGSASDPPPFELTEPDTTDSDWGHGLTQLPAPDQGDVFLDFEGHPFWKADRGLFFLFGLLTRTDDGVWSYEGRWAHDESEERALTSELIEFLTERRATHPGMHVYHYNHTERSELERLAVSHGIGEADLTSLVASGLFVDLLPIVRNSVQIGTESYGLKFVERVTGFERAKGVERGADAVIEYEHFMSHGNSSSLEGIAAYNEDDVRATLAVRDWLVAQRNADLPWREAEFPLAEETPASDEQIKRLHEYPVNSPEHLLGDVLGYWRRERRAQLGPLVARCQEPVRRLLDDATALTGLTPVGLVERVSTKGRALVPAMRFSMPPQESSGIKSGTTVVWGGPDRPARFATIVSIDTGAGYVDLSWNQSNQEEVDLPLTVIVDDWIHPKPKPQALSAIADGVLSATSSVNPATLALLRADFPTFYNGGGPTDGHFTDDVDEIRDWVRFLDGTCVAIQGPPGTGKTFRGAHVVHSLITSGQRVGITAMSHAAIANLLAEVHGLFAKSDDLDRLRAVVKTDKANVARLEGVEYTTGITKCAKLTFNLVAGTTWLFAGDPMSDAPVDVLIVDEAGQLALADALAASRSAKNLVLLGDPLQLAQVSQAAHPGGGGRSVLEHVLGGHQTMPTDRGVFLEETRRMHPDVCGFVSDAIYEGRLSSHPDCARQVTAAGTGLRWLRAEHHGCVTASREEAELVAAEIKRIIGTTWTNSAGEQLPLTVADVMVVAPYNDQVNLVRSVLDADPTTAGVPVGTVDRFQGQEAAVVFFTMTASSGRDITRGTDFLFSRNRLNVAISRARCLAYLVCTDALLDTTARNIEQMRLIGTVCNVVERAQLLDADAR